MSDPLEDEIRRALARRAADLPPKAADPLRRIDYRTRQKTVPRRSHRLRLRSAIGAAGMLLAAGVAAAVVLLSSGAPSAYAGWSPVPTIPTPSAVAAARAACRAMHPGPLAARAAGGKLVLTDSRGRYTAVVLTGDNVLEICLSDGPHRGAGVEGVNLGLTAKPGPDQLADDGGGGGSARGFPGGGGEENRVGRAGSDVTGVKFIFANRVTVDATVQNGFYFAWWPTRLDASHRLLSPSSNPTSVEITTKSGKAIRSPMSCRPSTDACVFVALNPQPVPARH